jgi:multiple sugar transport system ATP-binding protein
MAEISMEQVEKIYPDGTLAVSALDLDVQDGHFMVLVGPSGCGKTTLLRMVAGLEDITSGLIRIGEQIVNEVEPVDRDIAMVFQNYALYPHMSIYKNLAFGLTFRGFNRRDIDSRVREAANILGLKELLNKKPGQLSGGQRQRVAMGRAIVRQPRAFLMDEPLSNLDAKLRVQMRTEISRIQRELGVTTIYVTHDQTEAMTMGDRVAVLKKGVLQQVDNPQVLYDRPVNLFVAGFIGSPAMNLVEAQLQSSDGDTFVVFGNFRLKVDDEVLEARPGLKDYAGQKVILGIRPEDMDDASLVGEAPEDRRMSVRLDLREAMGSEVYAHFTVDAPPVVSDDTRELAADAGTDALEQLQIQQGDNKAGFIGRFSPRTRVREGAAMEVFVDTRSLHLFDPRTGEGIYDGVR